MAIDLVQLRGYLKQVLGMLPLFVTINGVEYSGTKTSKQDEVELRVAGLLPENVFSIYLDRAALASIPEVNDEAVIDSITYRIVEIGNDPADVYIRLDLGNEFATRR